jgi:sugar phosphate isomerase/epimerase
MINNKTREGTMRFGIMAMQLDALIPSHLAPNEIASHIISFSQVDLVKRLHAPGFNPIEIGGDLAMFLPHTFAPETIEGLVRLKQDLGILYTVHLPLWSVEPSTPLSPVRSGSVRAIIDIINSTSPLDPEIYVIHATGSLAGEFSRMKVSEVARHIILQRFQSAARESVRIILDETGIPSRKLASETIEVPFDMTVELAEEYDLSIFFDTAHVLVGYSGRIDVFEALERSLPRLGEVHLQDGPWQGPQGNIQYGMDHLPLGEGDLDIFRFLKRLDEANFDGPIIFELTLEEALASLKLVHSLYPNLVT